MTETGHSASPSADETPFTPTPTPELLPASAKRPRLWPAITVVILGMPAALAIAILVILVYAGFVDGFHALLRPSYYESLTGRPGMVIASIVGTEAGLGAVALIPAFLSPMPWYKRLGLVGIGRFGRMLPLLMLATFAINDLLSVTLARFIGAPEDYMTPIMSTLDEVGASGRLIMILSITVLAGFAEEILFRGYLQRRFLERWPVWVAIGAASVLFAAAHFSPSYAIYILPLGVWLGVVAWRTGSTWCSIACHLFNNLVAAAILYVGVVTKMDMRIVERGETLFAIVAVPVVIWAVYVLFKAPTAAAAENQL